MVSAVLFSVLGGGIGSRTLGQAQILDPSYNGVWVSDQGDPFVIYSSINPNRDPTGKDSGFHACLDERFYDGGTITLVDNGGYYGAWEARRRLELDLNPADRIWDNVDYPEIKAPYALPPFLPTVAPTESEAGELRLTFTGSTSSLMFNMRDGHQLRIFNGPVHFAGKSSKVSVSGTYKDKDLQVNISEGDGRSVRKEEGIFKTIDGHTFSFYGLRVWDRGTFTLRDRDNGSEAGYGWLVWRPTRTFAKSLAGQDDPGPVDRIEIYVVVRGAFSNGAQRQLMRVE